MRGTQILAIARKEMAIFFSGAIGVLFLGVFLAVTLFTFFWLSAFFARNIADVRPLFEAMPVLLIFLSAALTMRMWSEERRTGTLEFVATLPVSVWEFVFGKFLACWLLLGIALMLTLALPITVALIANLDWGPVVAGYLAAALMGGSYVAIGLFVSARTDSQIVALIVTTVVCGALYLIGQPAWTGYFSGGLAEVFALFGSGARFESIARGVLDVRDLAYYVSIIAVFLALNVYALVSARWSRTPSANHGRWRIATALVVANALLLNVWMAPLSAARLDMTDGQIYSISDATRSYLGELREPLLIRGYFSSKTHPLLAPLVPRMRDLLAEYEVAGKGNVRVEIIDPAQHPELEDEANTKYGIRPVPFQVADRYQSALVNSYFDVLLSYGDEYEVLGFRDLIEVKVVSDADIDVQLRNPEFDITRAVKKVLYGFQGGANLFANITSNVTFNGYVSADARLPQPLVEFRATLGQVLDELSASAQGRLAVHFVDPDAGDGSVARQIGAEYGFQPMAASLFDANTFYFYLTLTDGETLVQLPLPEAFSADAIKKTVEDGLKRFASGLLKTVALNAPPPPNPYMAQQGMAGNQFTQLQEVLTGDFDVQTTDLASGRLTEQAEILLVVDPNNLNEKQVFAIDQFLMRGGTVVLSTAPYAASLTQQSLSASERKSGLEDWLAHLGITIAPKLVMDPQNAAFPVPVTRQVGGFSFQDLMMLDYPYFPDIRESGMPGDHPILAGLPGVAMSWSSPISIAEDKTYQRVDLLRSSPGSWLSADTNVMPRFDEQGQSLFVPQGETASQLLAVGLTGRFDSFFAGKPSPLHVADESAVPGSGDEDSGDSADTPTPGHFDSVIERSPESARLFVFASNDFLADQTLRMIGSADGMLYLNSVQMIANLADWALEDNSLTAIRARGQFNRTLPPMEKETQRRWEYVNYVLAAVGLALVVFVYTQLRRRKVNRQREWLVQGGAA